MRIRTTKRQNQVCKSHWEVFLTWGLREGANGGGGEGMGLDLLCDTVGKLGRPTELALLNV